jgi:Flp pilus assembly protein TadG
MDSRGVRRSKNDDEHFGFGDFFLNGVKVMQFRLKSRPGSIAALTAVSMLAVLAVLAMVMDGGLLQDKRRSVQAAADAAAMAAASDIWENYAANGGTDPAGDARNSALSTAAANGYNNDGTTNTVTVNIAPVSGNFAGVNGYAEVIITVNQARAFSTIWGRTTLPVTAKAVAGGKPGNVGILMLNAHTTIVAQIGNNVNILGGGALYINSDATVRGDIYNLPYGAYLESTAHLTTGGIYTVSALGREAGSVITYTNGGTLNTGVSPLPDPFGAIPQPVIPAGTPNYGSPVYQPPKNATQTFHMSPGIYSNIQVKAGATVIMDPGIYYVHGGGMTLAAGSTVTGDGVMFYDMPNNYFTIPAGASVDVGAPTSGTYRGISVFEPRNLSNEIHIITAGNITLGGALYAPAGEFDIRPSLATTVYNFGAYICDQAEWGPPGSTLGTINLNPGASAPTKRPLLVQ